MPFKSQVQKIWSGTKGLKATRVHYTDSFSMVTKHIACTQQTRQCIKMVYLQRNCREEDDVLAVLKYSFHRYAFGAEDSRGVLSEPKSIYNLEKL